ncbi:IS630 family transposase [Psychrobium sp. 1_MG-2023]|uniref:IS630 family transposase n=1 Tax=Psychrobium sp. 1_MG-2023 TaxID=3062624 RepID=UPI002736278C|nr:IS630 family transposase [Psychrobium sp. 1_MG-2023]MDP2562013.1 IS630 family transposase [Psychrobium sp. 1_MG-2023]
MALIDSNELIRLSKKEKNANKRIRLLAVAHFLECQNRTHVANTLKVSRRSVNNWVSNYLSQGLSGLEDKPRLGRKAQLSPQQTKQLASYIEHQAKSEVGGRLTGHDIKDYISTQFGVDYHLNHVYKLLKKVGFSWIKSRSKHPKQSQKAQDEFKKIEHTMIQTIPGTVSLSQVDIWFQDEGRFGQQNTTTRIWAKTGTRPRAVQQQQFEYAYMYGAVCPATGETEAIITPLVSKEMMIQHLSQISEKTEAGRYAVVIMDGAGWHTDDIAFEFDNRSTIKLPPYSPELYQSA